MTQKNTHQPCWSSSPFVVVVVVVVVVAAAAAAASPLGFLFFADDGHRNGTAAPLAPTFAVGDLFSPNAAQVPPLPPLPPLLPPPPPEAAAQMPADVLEDVGWLVPQKWRLDVRIPFPSQSIYVEKK